MKGPHPDLANDNPFNVWNVWPVLDGIREVRVNRSVLCTLSKLDRVECKDMDSDNGRSVSIGGVDDFVVWASFYVCGRKKPGPWSCKAGTSTGKPNPAEADVETAISAVAGDHTAYADEGHICVVDPAGGVACRMTTDPRKDPWTRWGRTPLEVHDWPVASIVFGGDQACMLGTDRSRAMLGRPEGRYPERPPRATGPTAVVMATLETSRLRSREAERGPLLRVRSPPTPRLQSRNPIGRCRGEPEQGLHHHVGLEKGSTNLFGDAVRHHA